MLNGYNGDLLIITRTMREKTARSKRALVVTELFNIEANDFDANKSIHCNRTHEKRDPEIEIR